MDRYAIFFAPSPDTLLWKLGCLWHGRDPETGRSLRPPPPVGMNAARQDEITRSARHYGFHATLKPPFAPKAGTRIDDLEAGLAGYAAGASAIVAPALEFSRIGGFLALTLTGPCPALDRLCARCVADFDGWRAEESAAKVEERRRAGLTPRQEALLGRWGYPYVMEEFRFHMTLTMWLEEPELSLVERHLRGLFRSVLAMPLYIDRVVLFEELDGAPMRARRAFPFGRR
jgi:hypothetical protein